MDNTFFSAETIVAILGIIITVLISIIGGIYAIITNTKRYELTENYRIEILQWYTSVVNLMIKIIHLFEDQKLSSTEFLSRKYDMLSQLSALAEVGRFYFPNVIKKDGFGDDKPAAYQGYRHIVLEFVLHFYFIASNNNDSNNIARLWKLERHFTSFIFKMIEPRKRNKVYSKNLSITIPKGKTIDEFLDEDYSNIDAFCG